jgi:hypothetical protein
MWKMGTIIPDHWWMLLAGDVSAAFALSEAIKEKAKNAGSKKVRDFARLCASAYREERKRLIESDVLTDYDLNSYEEYQALKATDRKFFDEIAVVIGRFDEDLGLLICGFDKEKKPHIFSIVEGGKIQYCDLQGYGVAGSGSWAAHSALDRYSYNKWNPLGECIWGVMDAKFCAEKADGVGRDTIMFILNPPSNSTGKIVQPVIYPDAIDTIYRKAWEGIPRLPDGIVKQIEGNLANVDVLPEELKKLGVEETGRRINKPKQ